MMSAGTSHQETGLYAQSDRDPKSSSPQPQHRRGYQACDPCRKRKVKCDLGSMFAIYSIVNPRDCHDQRFT
jgi:hypothetical protein